MAFGLSMASPLQLRICLSLLLSYINLALARQLLPVKLGLFLSPLLVIFSFSVLTVLTARAYLDPARIHSSIPSHSRLQPAASRDLCSRAYPEGRKLPRSYHQFMRSSTIVPLQ
jgi:hypothetical protein